MRGLGDCDKNSVRAAGTRRLRETREAISYVPDAVFSREAIRGMPLHLIKLCVGCESIEDLASWQVERLKARRKAGEKKPQLFHRTFQTPKRRDELLAGGSLYWVIKGLVQVRQPLLDITEGTKEDGTPCCMLILQNELVAVRPMPRPPVQGWRCREPDEPPGYLRRRGATGITTGPPKLRKQLAEL